MSGVSEALFLQLLYSSLSIGAYGCIMCGKRARRRMKKGKDVFVILTSRKSGITTQLKTIDNYNSSAILIDVMEDVVGSMKEDERNYLTELSTKNQEAFGMKIYPIVHKYIGDMRKTYPNRPLLLFTSDVSLVEYLKVDEKQVACLLPTMGLFQKLVSEFNEGDVKLIAESRERLISLHYPKFLYGSFRELKDKLTMFVNKQ